MTIPATSEVIAFRCPLVIRGNTNPFDVDDNSSRLEVPGEPVPMPTLCVALLIVIPGIEKVVEFEIILFVKSGVPLPVSSVEECAKSFRTLRLIYYKPSIRQRKRSYALFINTY